MKEFFKKEFETLQIKTGLRQFDNLTNGKTAEEWKPQLTALIDLMVVECNRPPFHILTEKAKEGIISRAIIEDQDFIGLNAKFVRKALNAFWVMYGDKILEAYNKPDNDKRVELTPEQDEKVNEMLKDYHKQLLSEGGFKAVPKLTQKEYEREGAEWKSEIERKGIKYPKTPLEVLEARDLHIRYLQENYDPYTGKPKPGWISEEEWLKNQKA